MTLASDLHLYVDDLNDGIEIALTEVYAFQVDSQACPMLARFDSGDARSGYQIPHNELDALLSELFALNAQHERDAYALAAVLRVAGFVHACRCKGSPMQVWCD